MIIRSGEDCIRKPSVGAYVAQQIAGTTPAFRKQFYGMMPCILLIIDRIRGMGYATSYVNCHKHALVTAYHEDIIMPPFQLRKMLLMIPPAERNYKETVHLLIRTEEFYDLASCGTRKRSVILMFRLLSYTLRQGGEVYPLQ